MTVPFPPPAPPPAPGAGAGAADEWWSAARAKLRGLPERHPWVLAWLGFALVTAGVAAAVAHPPSAGARLQFAVSVWFLACGALAVCVNQWRFLLLGFRKSALWGIGMLTPCIHSMVSLAFLIRHWSESRVLLGWIAMGWTALGIGYVALPFADCGWDDEGGYAVWRGTGLASGDGGPPAAFAGLQAALRKEDYAGAFEFLTPGQRAELLADLYGPVGWITASGQRGALSQERAKLHAEAEAVLEGHGIALEPGQFDWNLLDEWTDKGRLFQELAAPVRSLDPGNVIDRRLRPLQNATLSNVKERNEVDDDIAAARVDGRPCQFVRVRGRWLLNLPKEGDSDGDARAVAGAQEAAWRPAGRPGRQRQGFAQALESAIGEAIAETVGAKQRQILRYQTLLEAAPPKRGSRPASARADRPPATAAALETRSAGPPVVVKPVHLGGPSPNRIRALQLRLENRGEASVRELKLQMDYLDANGARVGGWTTVHSGARSLADGNATNEIHLQAFFVPQFARGVRVTLEGVTFTDGSRWPAF